MRTGRDPHPRTDDSTTAVGPCKRPELTGFGMSSTAFAVDCKHSTAGYQARSMVAAMREGGFYQTQAHLQKYAAQCCLAIHDVCIPARDMHARCLSVQEQLQTSQHHTGHAPARCDKSDMTHLSR